MCRWIHSAGLGLISCVLVTLPGKGAEIAQEQTSPELRPLSFGLVTAGTVFTVPVHIYNKQDVPLAIEKVTTSCGCAVVGDIPSSVQPGSYEIVPVRVNTTGKQGQFPLHIEVKLAGRQPKVYSGNGFIVAERMSNIELKKPIVAGEPMEFVLDWHREDSAIDTAVYDETRFMLSWIRRPETDEYWFTMVPKNLPPGPLREKVQLNTGSMGVPTRLFEIGGHVAGPVEAAPREVAFGYIDPGSSGNGKVILSSPSGRLFSVKAVAVRAGAPVGWEAGAAENREVEVRLTMTCPAGHTGPAIRSSLDITCDVEGAEHTVSVECYGLLRAPGSTG